MTTELRKISVGDFIFRVLSGVAIGIVVGLVPNAILGEIFKALMHHHPIFATLLHVVQALQFTVPALVGALIAIKFNMTPLAIAVVSSAAYVGSGAAQFKNGAWIIAGIGDLINTMITAAIAVLFILLIEKRVGSMALIVYPTIVGGLSATIGVFILPYVHTINIAIGNMINSFTELQPVLMCVGAAHFADQRVGLLSGGQQQLIRQAQALASEPELMLADEPLLSLDLARERDTVNRLDSLDAAVLCVTHSINPFLSVVDRVLYLGPEGHVVGTVDEVMRSDVLSELYGTHVDVAEANGRMVVL